jgi:hypothetical protein
MLDNPSQITTQGSVEHPSAIHYRDSLSAVNNQAFPLLFPELACCSFWLSHSLAFLKVVFASLLTMALSAAWMPALICNNISWLSQLYMNS